MTKITNFLRYPGSKRRLLDFLGLYLPKADEIRGIYYESFVGSGAVFFFIDPRNAVLSDSNNELIDLYKGIKINPQRVWEYYSNFGNDKEEYHRIRDTFTSEDISYKAARILYLNRTCFKGMWRHNLKGNFNVGYGGEDRRWVINLENILELSKVLSRASIICSDFETIIDSCEDGDFIFVDPPYKPGESEQKNQHYSGKPFTYQDHIRLSKTLRNATKRGVRWALTNSSHPDISKLYSNTWKVSIPFGTGKKPGVMISEPGEMLFLNYKM
jgi:DNA adenine methylase